MNQPPNEQVLNAAIGNALAAQTIASLPDTSGIYVMVNRNTGSVYVGKASNMRSRATTHRALMNAGRCNPEVLKDFKLHGALSFGFASIQECGPDELDALEGEYIRLALQHHNCVNIALPATEREPAKTAAQRVKETEARKRAAGLVRVCVWLHPDDAPALREAAAKLARKRQKESKREA